MKTVTPKRPPGRLVFVVQFRHPLHDNKVRKASLQTRDETEASAICRDLSALLNAPDLHHDPRAAARMGYLERAFEIFYGRKPPRTAPKAADVLFDELKRSSKTARERLETLEASELREKELAAEVEDLRRQVARLLRQQNLHVKVKIGEAVAAWKDQYPAGHAPKTVSEAFRALDLFVASLPKGEKARLGTIRAGDISSWVASLRQGEAPDAPPLAPKTKKKLRSYVSGFWTWAFEKYDLTENPIAKAGKVAGVARTAENIKAIRREADLHELLHYLGDWPYWRAFVATACLAGPRWGDLKRLKIDEVIIGGGYIRVSAQKVGSQRNVPIEKSTLLPILRDWIVHRQAERAGNISPDTPLFDGSEFSKADRKAIDEGLRSPFLFPSMLKRPRIQRKKTSRGEWSDSSNFLNAWGRIKKKARAQARAEGKGSGAFWNFGPREWRHCAGTAMGHSGCSSLMIAQWLVTSEKMCREHYVAPVTAGRWSFDWGQ